MRAGSRDYRAYLSANAVIVVLVIALLSTQAHGGDLLDISGELPELEFDVPALVVAKDVTPCDFRPLAPGDRLVQVRVPVSVVVLHGDVRRVREVIIEIDGSAAGLTVHDFSPDTQLASDRVDNVQVETIEERRHGIDASLGGALPIAGGTAHLTPSVTTGNSQRTASTVKETRLPPKQAVLVSGAVNRRQGVYFKLRQSSQTTLEGEHELTVTFVAPADWEGGSLEVECVGRGEKRYLFVKQRKVWNASRTPIEVRLANYTVAKPVSPCGCEDDGAEQTDEAQHAESAPAQHAGSPTAGET